MVALLLGDPRRHTKQRSWPWPQRLRQPVRRGPHRRARHASSPAQQPAIDPPV